MNFIIFIREPKGTRVLSSTPPDSRGGNDCNLHLRLPALRPPFCLHPSPRPISITSPAVSTSRYSQHASLSWLTDSAHIGPCSQLWRRRSPIFFIFFYFLIRPILENVAELFTKIVQPLTHFLSLMLKCWHMCMKMLCIHLNSKYDVYISRKAFYSVSVTVTARPEE